MEKKRALSCMNRGPGPQYKLKTLTGFEDHDPSKHRYPAYSIRIRPKAKLQSTGPGPYSFPLYLTHHGPEIPPAYTIANKPHSKYKDMIPGPGAYAPEKNPTVTYKRPAAYTMLFRGHTCYKKIGPGPIYMLPTCIGPEIPDIRAEAAYSMAFKRKPRKESLGPGPAAYDVKPNLIKKQCPAYSMKFRRKEPDSSRFIPGPQYNFNTDLIKRRQPMFSFGVKYSECATVGLTENDD